MMRPSPRRRRRPFFWLLFICTTLTFLLQYLAFILPYWFATRDQNSSNRFLRLGLWEVCFDKFSAWSSGPLVYDGCFFLIDPQLTSLRPVIIRDFFVALQVLFTLSFSCSIIGQTTITCQALNVLSPFGPKAVLLLMLSTSFSSLFIFLSLIIMGVGVDNEVNRKPINERDWLVDQAASLNSSSLSWSYGLSGFALLFSFLTSICLGWFVYPKRVGHGGALLPKAWCWPSWSDLVCRPQLNNLRLDSNRRLTASRSGTTTPAGSYYHSSRLAPSSSSRWTSGSFGRQPPRSVGRIGISEDASTTLSLANDMSRSLVERSGLVGDAPSLSSTNNTASTKLGEMSGTLSRQSQHDPRSADAISLASFDDAASSIITTNRNQSNSSRIDSTHSGLGDDQRTLLSAKSSSLSTRSSQRLLHGWPPRQEAFVAGAGSESIGHLSANSYSLEGSGIQSLALSSDDRQSLASRQVQVAQPMRKRSGSSRRAKSSIVPPVVLEQDNEQEAGYDYDDEYDQAMAQSSSNSYDYISPNRSSENTYANAPVAPVQVAQKMRSFKR